MSSEKEVTSAFSDLWPFLALGGAGGFVKALNDKNFSIKDLVVRVVTGAFCAFLGGLYLTSTNYPLEVQYAFSGAVGVAGSDLIKALMRRMSKEITGEKDTDRYSDDSGIVVGGLFNAKDTSNKLTDNGDNED